MNDDDLVRSFAEGADLAAVARQFATTVPAVKKALRGKLRGAPAGELAIADPYGLYRYWDTNPYNPSELVTVKGLRTFDEMRKDEQLKAALTFKKQTVLSTGWEVVSPEGQAEDWEVTAFVEEQLDRLAGSFSHRLLEVLSALDYGYSVTEKVYGEDGGYVVLDQLKTKRPHPFGFRTDDFGNLTGLLQERPEGTATLPIEKFILFSHQMEFSNYYGTSDLEAAYRAWWSKKNAYRWLNMLLERYGIPPMFALYDPNAYTPGQVDDLFAALKSIQAATSGVVPRAETNSLELWSPELADNAYKVFMPALDKYDQHLAKAVLMPGLLGLTPDESVGSQARSKVHFDAFLLLVEYVRDDLAERVMMDQLIKPLVDLNFRVDAYPEFKFLPLTDEVRLDVFDTWTKLISGSVVKPTADDERHIRTSLEFPERDIADTEYKVPDPQDAPPVPPPNPSDQLPPNPSDRPEQQNNALDVRPVNDYERKLDLALIERDLTSIEDEATTDLTAAVTDVAARLAKWVATKFENDARQVTGLRELRGTPQVERAVGTMLEAAFRAGRSNVREEFARTAENRAFADDPNFVPADALKRLRTRKFWITGVVEQELLNRARGILIQSIDQGEDPRSTATRLQQRLVEGYVERKVAGETVRPNRIETIVRTNTTDAYNRGRLVEGRRAGDLLTGWEYSAILDSRTTEVCRYLDGKVFGPNDPDVDRLAPPRHHQCRSLLVPITVGETIDDADRATKAEVGRAIELSGKDF